MIKPRKLGFMLLPKATMIAKTTAEVTRNDTNDEPPKNVGFNFQCHWPVIDSWGR